MSNQYIGGFARHATSSLHRLSALSAAFSSTPLALVARPPANGAARKRKKKPGKPPASRCKEQGQQCVEFFAETCQQAPDPTLCETLAAPCCADLGKCNPAGFLVCLVASSG